MLKDSAKEIAVPLAHIINLSISTSTFPTIWKIAIVTPIHKSGSTNDEANYRPISVFPILSKIMEKAVYNQLKDYLEDNKLLSEQQFGYRKKRSTEIAAVPFLDDIRRNIEKGKLVGAVFMDLSRAFDTISLINLMTKLKAYGICGEEIQWFNDYLFNRKQCTQYGGDMSSNYAVLTGVPQGSLLGPLLFILYFNDFPDWVRNSKVIMYADDTVIYYAHEDKETIEKCLSQDCLQISDYLEETELVINL